MSTGAIVGIIIAVIVVVAVVVVASGLMRRARMRREFGPEYDRLARELGPRKAQAELTARKRRVEELGIRPLAAEQQARYGGDWTVVQERFVDAPAESLSAADALIWDVMRDRGYPVGDRNASIEALSVYHARQLDGYRQVQDMRTDSASTEELRQAMIRYRALFEDLTGARMATGQLQRAGRSGHGAAADDSRAGAGTSDRTAANGEVAPEDSDRAADMPR